MNNEQEGALAGHPIGELPQVWRPLRVPSIAAHRGYSGRAPENSLAALRLALACGVPVIEVDVRATRDGVPVVLHDGTLDRTTNGTGPVEDWVAEDLRRDVTLRGRWPEPVPTLADALALTKGRAVLALEIKVPEVTAAVLRMVESLHAERWVAVWSFHVDAVEQARRANPWLPVALLHRGRDAGAWNPGEFLFHASRLGASAVSFFPETLDTAIVEDAHERGLQVYAGTVNEVAPALRLAEMSIDMLITDQPVGLRSLFLR